MNTTMAATKIERGKATQGRKLYDCPRCVSKGTIRAFMHVAGGVCFLCMGARKIEGAAFAKAWRWDGDSLMDQGCGIGLRDLCAKSRAELLQLAHYMYLGGSPEKFVASTAWNMAHLACFCLATGDRRVEDRAADALAKLGGDAGAFRSILEAIRPFAAECRKAVR